MGLYVFYLIAVVTLLLGLYNLIKTSKHSSIMWRRPIEAVYYSSWVYLIAPLITFGTLYTYIPIRGEVSGKFWLVTFCLLFATALQAIIFYLKLSSGLKKIRIIAQLFIFLVAIGVVTYATIDSNHPFKAKDQHQTGIDDIQESAFKITENISTLDSIINKETEIINNTFVVLLEQIRKKSIELKSIEKEKANYIEQIEFYKNLSGLSKSEAKTVIEQLENSSNDYSIINLLASFMMGAFASVIGSFVFSLISKKHYKAKKE